MLVFTFIAVPQSWLKFAKYICDYKLLETQTTMGQKNITGPWRESSLSFDENAVLL